MVQLHAAYAGLRLTRTTLDVDMILHIDSGAATFAGCSRSWSDSATCCVNRSVTGQCTDSLRGSRGAETIDVMVADRLSLKRHPKALRRKVFAVPGGTSALRKTVNCEVTAGEVVVVLSIPDVFGALVLKGA